VRQFEAIPDDGAGRRDWRTSDENLAGCVIVPELESSLEGDQDAMLGLVERKLLDERIQGIDC
jgi:hypothetical protein